jgi:hypothetical protein
MSEETDDWPGSDDSSSTPEPAHDSYENREYIHEDDSSQKQSLNSLFEAIHDEVTGIVDILENIRPYIILSIEKNPTSAILHEILDFSDKGTAFHSMKSPQDDTQQPWTCTWAQLYAITAVLNRNQLLIQMDHDMGTTPSENEMETTPSENEIETTPSEIEMETTPSENEMGTTPSENDTGTTLSENDTETTPSGMDIGTTPSENDTGTTPSENDTGITKPKDDDAAFIQELERFALDE